MRLLLYQHSRNSHKDGTVGLCASSFENGNDIEMTEEHTDLCGKCGERPHPKSRFHAQRWNSRLRCLFRETNSTSIAVEKRLVELRPVTSESQSVHAH
jgi:hypothetical protein